MGRPIRFHEELPRGLDVVTALSKQRRERDGPAAGRRREHVAEQIAPAEAERALARLDRDPHRAAAHKTGVPGEVLGQLVLAERCLACADDALCLDERVAL